MDYISGEILTEEGLKKGYVGFEGEKILEQGKSSLPKKPLCKGLIVPSFVNAHTHIGDSFIKDKITNLQRDVEKLVAPPNGLKHKLLKNADGEDIIEGMEKSIDIMLKNGVGHFCDFRENGIRGICQMKSAMEHWSISSTILSRPKDLTYDKDEISLLLKNSHGVGLSALSDWEYDNLEKISRHTKKEKKIFAIHASERIREDIDKILDLKPDFLIHMVKASESDLIRVKDNNISIVLCPRSNSFFGLKADFKMMKQIEVKLMLGTDNAMINSPSVLDEIRFLKVANNVFSIEELLNMSTFTPRKVLNLSPCILGANSPADFVVLDKKTLKILYVSRVR